MIHDKIKTLGDLIAQDYKRPRVIDQIRANLRRKLKTGEPIFEGLIGYNDTVIPQLYNALRSGHHILLIGERGQAKSKIARQLSSLLDEIPVLEGCPINDNPLRPLCHFCKMLIAEKGKEAKIRWMTGRERFRQILSTADISSSEIIGDIDPIKVAEGRYLIDPDTFSPGKALQANNGILYIDELPDLAPKTQVSLFNLMEEGIVVAKGYPIEFPVDLLLVATANPVDYTTTGKIVEPLLDRFGSGIPTHYPRTLEEERKIMIQGAFSSRDSQPIIPVFMQEIIVQITIEARNHPDVDQVKGISVRMTIDNYENLISQAEERFDLKNVPPIPRISDLTVIRASMYPKLELTYMTSKSKDQIIDELCRKAILKICTSHFAKYNWETLSVGNFRVSTNMVGAEYIQQLDSEPELKKLVDQYIQDQGLRKDEEMIASVTEAILEGLYVAGRLKKREVDGIMGQVFGPD